MAAVVREAPRFVRQARLYRLARAAPLALWVGAAILTVHLAAAAVGWVWTPYGWQDIKAGPPVAPASWEHPFGVDQSGRDVLSRVLYGGHIVILLALSGTALGVAIGGGLGLLSGYLRGWFDEVLMRVVDAVVSIPFLILALLIVAVAGPTGAGDLRLLVLVVAIVYAPRAPRGTRRRHGRRHPRLRDRGPPPLGKRGLDRRPRDFAQLHGSAPGRVRAARRLRPHPDRLVGLSRLRGPGHPCPSGAG